MLQKIETEKQFRQGGPSLLDKIRAAAEARAKLRAALEREKESNEALCLRTAGLVRKLQLSAKQQGLPKPERGEMHGNDRNGTCLVFIFFLISQLSYGQIDLPFLMHDFECHPNLILHQPSDEA